MALYACSDLLCYQAWHHSRLPAVLPCSDSSKDMGAVIMQMMMHAWAGGSSLVY